MDVKSQHDVNLLGGLVDRKVTFPPRADKEEMRVEGDNGIKEGGGGRRGKGWMEMVARGK
jgi:hypothetical protein